MLRLVSAGATAIDIKGVQKGISEPETGARKWSWEDLAGRFIEVSGQGVLTVAAGLVLEAQLRSEPVGWVTHSTSSFFPPDLAASGVDLDALVVVRVRGAKDGARATSRLTCSGAFGLVVYDMAQSTRDTWMPTAVQGRLSTAAQRNHTALVCLTDKPKDAPSLGSMVSLRAEVERMRKGEGRYGCKVNVVKDKRSGPGWSLEQLVRDPIV